MEAVVEHVREIDRSVARANLDMEISEQGLRPEFLHAMCDAQGPDAVEEWLTDHNFWDLAGRFGGIAYLLRW